MSIHTIRKCLVHLGTRLKVTRFAAGALEIRRCGEVEIARDGLGTFVHITFGSPETEVLLVEFRPGERSVYFSIDGHLIVCGRDGAGWYVIDVPGAKRRCVDSLLAGARRHGDWMFVPAPDVDVDPALILRGEALYAPFVPSPTVEYLYPTGGEVLYASRELGLCLDETEYEARCAAGHDEDILWTVLRHDPELYARGRVEYPELGAIDLASWHRVETAVGVRRCEIANVT